MEFVELSMLLADVCECPKRETHGTRFISTDSRQCPALFSYSIIGFLLRGDVCVCCNLCTEREKVKPIGVDGLMQRKLVW